MKVRLTGPSEEPSSPGQEIAVWFKYEYGAEIVRNRGTVRGTLTTCYLHEVGPDQSVSQWVKIGEGMAFCPETEQFEKATGRTLALRRTLAGMFWLTREQRRQIWLTYLSTHRFTAGRPKLSAAELERLQNRLRVRREREEEFLRQMLQSLSCRCSGCEPARELASAAG